MPSRVVRTVEFDVLYRRFAARSSVSAVAWVTDFYDPIIRERSANSDADHVAMTRQNRPDWWRTHGWSLRFQAIDQGGEHTRTRRSRSGSPRDRPDFRRGCRASRGQRRLRQRRTRLRRRYVGSPGTFARRRHASAAVRRLHRRARRVSGVDLAVGCLRLRRQSVAGRRGNDVDSGELSGAVSGLSGRDRRVLAGRGNRRRRAHRHRHRQYFWPRDLTEQGFRTALLRSAAGRNSLRTGHRTRPDRRDPRPDHGGRTRRRRLRRNSGDLRVLHGRSDLRPARSAPRSARCPRWLRGLLGQAWSVPALHVFGSDQRGPVGRMGSQTVALRQHHWPGQYVSARRAVVGVGPHPAVRRQTRSRLDRARPREQAVEVPGHPRHHTGRLPAADPVGHGLVPAVAPTRLRRCTHRRLHVPGHGTRIVHMGSGALGAGRRRVEDQRQEHRGDAAELRKVLGLHTDRPRCHGHSRTRVPTFACRVRRVARVAAHSADDDQPHRVADGAVGIGEDRRSLGDRGHGEERR